MPVERVSCNCGKHIIRHRSVFQPVKCRRGLLQALLLCIGPHLLRRDGMGVVLVPGVGGQGLLHRRRAARRVIVHLWELLTWHLAIGPQRRHAARLALLRSEDVAHGGELSMRHLAALIQSGNPARLAYL